MVGPPHPISHLRPLLPLPLFAPTSSQPSSRRLISLRHSLDAKDLQYRLQLRRLETLPSEFWLTSNTLFEAARAEYLAHSDPGTPEVEQETEFLKWWLEQRRTAYAEHSFVWWTALSSVMWPGVIAKGREWTWRLACWWEGEDPWA
jgi:Apoptogenic protein 1